MAEMDPNPISNRNPEEPTMNEEDDDEARMTTSSTVLLDSTSDISKALTDRYAKSKAPQHRHLIATAAAIRSILVEEGLPLTPPAYFAASISALEDSDRSDSDSISALSTLLSILLSVDSMETPPAKARDAACVVADFLKSDACLGTGNVRSLVKSLGLLALRVDLEDWSALELPLQTLLVYAVDKRPKVRKCAQDCVEKVFKASQGTDVRKSASKAVFSMYKKYMPLSVQISSDNSKSENLEALHMLNLMTAIVPDLSKIVRIKIMSGVYELLGCSFWSCTRHMLRLLEALVECLRAEDIVSHSEIIFYSLTSYICTDNNPLDTIISALILLKNCLKKLHDAQPSLWIKFLPPVFKSFAGHLNSDANTSKRAEAILKELISMHINQKHLLTTISASCNYEKDNPEMVAISSICAVFDQVLGACDSPPETMLAIISVLFLSLGELSYFLMKDIFMKLSRKMMGLKAESPDMKHLEACIGTAVIAMGPEKVLSMVPISVDADKGTCSNTMMLAILKKYVMGSSLKYFMEHIVPLAKSVQNACKKVKKQSTLKELQSCFHGLWDLLPAFCRYPTDTCKSFKAFSKLLITSLEDSPSLLETIASAVQELVNGTSSIIKNNQCVNLPTSFILDECNMEARSLLFGCSKKTASRDMKALACSSVNLFQVLTDIFLVSPPEKRTSLKEAIGCLAHVLGTEKITHYFVSLMEKCKSRCALIKSRRMEDEIQKDDMDGGTVEKTINKGDKKMRCLMFELASAFVEAADEDLTNRIFGSIKSYLLDSDGTCQSEAYYTLNKILEVHSWFCLDQIDELMDLLFSVNIPVDSETTKNRFLCFHHLLVHILKRNDKGMDTKAFLILNEIIITLKTKKESRKLAYNILLNISCTLKDSGSTDEESDLKRLFNMVMGYLSSSSPHIMSGAISALSLLIYNDAGFCIAVPNLIPSVLSLLQNKSIEVIKAALGFIKVLVSSLQSHDLIKFLGDILDAMLPWSSVSKNHFRSKVGIILEILIRKCGVDAVALVAPDKYKGFVKTIDQGRQRKKKPDELSNSESALEPADAVKNGRQKRALEDPSNEHLKTPSDYAQRRKRRKQQEGNTTTNNNGSVGSGRGQLSKPNVPSRSGNSFYAPSRSGNRFGGRNDKRKNGDEKLRKGSKMISSETKKYNCNKKAGRAAIASKSNASSKPSKCGRKAGHKVTK